MTERKISLFRELDITTICTERSENLGGFSGHFLFCCFSVFLAAPALNSRVLGMQAKKG